MARASIRAVDDVARFSAAAWEAVALALHADAHLVTIGWTGSDRAVLALVAWRAEAKAPLTDSNAGTVVWTDVGHEAHLAVVTLVTVLALAHTVHTQPTRRAVGSALPRRYGAVESAVADIARANSVVADTVG